MHGKVVTVLTLLQYLFNISMHTILIIIFKNNDKKKKSKQTNMSLVPCHFKIHHKYILTIRMLSIKDVGSSF